MNNCPNCKTELDDAVLFEASEKPYFYDLKTDRGWTNVNCPSCTKELHMVFNVQLRDIVELELN